jgi:hypothetical protein
MVCQTTTPANSSDFTLAEYFELFEGEGIVTETILVTPDFAREALARNIINRPLSEQHVDELVWEQTAGKWELTHQGIAFNLARAMIDGQHRCTAVVRSGIPALMRVTFNLAADFTAPIDTGLKVRQPKDVLRLSGREQAICNALITLERGSHRKGSAARIAGVHAFHRAGIDWAKQAFPYQRGITAQLMAGHAFAYPVAPRQVRSFAQQFLSHTGSSVQEPAVALRRFLERTARGGEDRALMLAVLRCLEAYCKGQPLARLSATESGLAYFLEQRAKKGL